MSVKEMLLQNREQLVKSYQNGESTCELGRQLKCSNASVYVFLRDTCGIKMRRIQTIADYDKEIRQLVQEQCTCATISTKLDLSYNTVNR